MFNARKLFTGAPEGSGHGAKAVAVLAMVVFVLLVTYGASGVRGDDQYWYVGDVDTLLDGGPRGTTHIFPAIIFRNLPLPPPFIHDILNLYLVLPFAKLVGAYSGWIWANILFSLAAAMVVYVLAGELAGRGWALPGAVFFLLCPLNVWEASQALAETTTMGLVALAMWVYLRAGREFGRWCLLTAVLAAMYYTRQSFILLLPMLPIAFLYHSRPVGKKDLLRAAALAGLVAGLVVARGLLFQSILKDSWSVISSNIPGKTFAMSPFFASSPIPVTGGEVALKFITNLAYPFFPPQPEPAIFLFYLSFYILAAAIVAVPWRDGREKERRLLFFLLALLAVHFATIMVWQNQFRYMLILMPALTVCGCLAAARFRAGPSCRSLLLGLFLVLVLGGLSVPLMLKSHRDGLHERATREQASKVIDHLVGQDEGIMLETSLAQAKLYSMFYFLVRPRYILNLASEITYTPEQYAQLRQGVKANWLVAPTNSPLPKILGASPADVQLPELFNNLRIYRLPAEKQ